MTLQIAYTQPYVPKYRVPLFNELAAELAIRGAQLTVFSGSPIGEQAGRNDDAGGTWQRRIRVSAVPLGRWSLEMREIPRELRQADLVVSELSGANILGWRRAISSRPLILWGHGKSYVNDGSWLSDHLEWALARRADHIMTYTPSGARYLTDNGGISGDKVTSIGNSTDTLELRREFLAAQKRFDRASRTGPVALFVGALDSTKRIDFVLAAFEQAVALQPRFKLLVAGEGPKAAEIDALASTDSRIVRYRDARGAALAELAVQADVIWMPGRVGLVAVDALAVGLPVHTVAHPYHAPEIELLNDDEVAFLPDEPSRFARASLERITDDARKLRVDIPTVQSVAKAMTKVIFKVLS